MLRLGSVFWRISQSHLENLKAIGFQVSDSQKFAGHQALFFGPDSIELAPASSGETPGIHKIEIESNDMSEDLKSLKTQGFNLPKPTAAKNVEEGYPLWAGLDVPESYTSGGLKAWMMMHSPQLLKTWADENLPFKHNNTCFGIESLSYSTKNPTEFIKPWAKLTSRPSSSLVWQELEKAQACRLNGGDKFLDAVNSKNPEGVFMITLKVTNLELTKEICEKAGAKTTPCQSRDGFILDQTFLGGISLRFVRAFWKKYLPEVDANTPYFRREDKFRPLGGANTSTLEKGFEDDWSF